MTAIRNVTVYCNWPGCERVFHAEGVSRPAARRQAQGNGWHSAVGLDFCLLHPRHEVVLAPGAAPMEVSCAGCGELSEGLFVSGPEAVQELWIAHLPKLLSAPTSLGDEENRRRGALVTLKGES